MRTKLDDYCQQFTHGLEPLLLPLERACTSLQQASHGTPGRDLAPALGSARHDLLALAEKVKSQQAYVLIFGPLKSGKSTLMNAVASAYVSEVSSLPAYPCLVFVGSGPRREYALTRYDGSSTTIGDASALTRTIDEAHATLADAIRTAEQQRIAFDPQQHLPTAIRRIDVRLPDSELETRGAVLVDTPGLYTRMRFGYDRLTRDFRDAAACAVFVVKSDTLFLEQVFAEFEELLHLFSRVFLVVNVDSGKRDVAADGRLVPSIEQSQPSAILRAFQQLAMPAALHRAATEGRVRMFPVDLLRAAAAVLQKKELPADFAQFNHELGAFLGSDEYLTAFLRDSLRRADRLLRDVDAAMASNSRQELAARIDELKRQLDFTQAELDLLRRAAERDYSPAFTRAEQIVHDELERTARDDGQKLLRALGASIDTWFLSGHSLQWLIHDHWRPLLADYRAGVVDAARRAFEQVNAQPQAGLELPSAVIDLCQRRAIDGRALRNKALAGLGAVADAQGLEVPVAIDAIPLKKTMLDMVAFRSLDAVRRRMFGDPARPDVKITAKDKAARMGEPGRLHLHQCVVQLRQNLVAAAVKAPMEHFGARLRLATIELLQQRLRAEVAPLQEKEARLQREIERLQALQQPLEDVATTLAAARATLPPLAAAYGAEQALAEPDVVLEPARRHRQPGRNDKTPVRE